MTRYATTLLVALASAQFAQAQISISYTGAAGESNVVNSLGTPLNGDTVSIGTFTNGFDPVANAGDLLALENHWANFDSTATRQITGVNGRFAATSPGVSDPTFLGQKIYLFITESGGSGVTEYGLFSSTSSTWVFPSTLSSPPPDAISSNEVNQYLFGSFISSPGTPSTPGSLQTEAVPVPEPGTAGLLGLGLLLGLSRRWKR